MAVNRAFHTIWQIRVNYSIFTEKTYIYAHPQPLTEKMHKCYWNINKKSVIIYRLETFGGDVHGIHIRNI